MGQHVLVCECVCVCVYFVSHVYSSAEHMRNQIDIREENLFIYAPA